MTFSSRSGKSGNSYTTWVRSRAKRLFLKMIHWRTSFYWALRIIRNSHFQLQCIPLSVWILAWSKASRAQWCYRIWATMEMPSTLLCLPNQDLSLMQRRMKMEPLGSQKWSMSEFHLNLICWELDVWCLQWELVVRQMLWFSSALSWHASTLDHLDFRACSSRSQSRDSYLVCVLGGWQHTRKFESLDLENLCMRLINIDAYVL